MVILFIAQNIEITKFVFYNIQSLVDDTQK